MINPDLSLIPKRDFRVRKRYYNGKTYLVKMRQMYEINAFNGELWKLSDGKRCVLDILNELLKYESHINDHHKYSKAVLEGFQYLNKIGFITFE